MIDRNDFGNRIIARIDRKLTALENDEWSAEIEVKILNGLIDALRKMKALTESDDNAAGSKINEYAAAFRSDAARGRETDTGSNGTDPADRDAADADEFPPFPDDQLDA